MKAPKIALLALLLPLAAHAKSIWPVPVHFAITNDAGMGNSWFVVGSHPDLGSWDRMKGVPLVWHDGNVWSADIALPAGAELEYKFVKQTLDASDFTDDAKAEWVPADNIPLFVPTDGIPPAPHKGKRVVLLWDGCPEPVDFWYSTLGSSDFESTNEWHVAAMTQTAPGRFEVDGVGEPGTWMRFTFHQVSEDWWYHFRPSDDEETDFSSPLDAFCVRDAQVFDYEPVPTDAGWVSASRIVATNVYSTADGIDGREIRIYLPRGYDENTSRRYPVVYFSDGQNVFRPGGQYGCWNAETAADREIRAGHMREAILVAVPCRTNDIPGMPGTSEFARLWEYLPSTDKLMTTDLQGLGANYADFLIHNVKPTLDWNFRTLSDRENTAHVGSSAGGLLSLYLGTAYGDVFGLVAPMSGVYNNEYIPNFRQWCQEHPDAVAQPKRVWLDTGTEETNIDGLNLYESNWDALALLRNVGHVPNKSLHFGVYTGWQGEHNEPAWADRIDKVFDFLLPVTDDFNPLLPRELSLSGDSIVMPVYANETPSLIRVPSLSPGVDPRTDPAATPVFTPSPTDHPWGTTNYPPADGGFYFLRSAP